MYLLQYRVSLCGVYAEFPEACKLTAHKYTDEIHVEMTGTNCALHVIDFAHFAIQL